MDIETQSVEFLDYHSSKSFPQIMREHILEDVFWLQESNDCARPYAIFLESNMLLL